ncbi:MAG: DsbA family protein [Longimicrobiales bacterium]
MARTNPKAVKRHGGVQPFYLVLGAVALAGVAAIAYAAVGRNGGDMAAEPVDMTALTNPRDIYAMAEPVVIGPTDAPNKLVVFSDFMCPGCQAWAQRIEPLLKERYADPGVLQIAYYDFPLGGSHVHSFLAARAARCAQDQGRFWEYHDLLFARQRDWSFVRAPASDFVDYAADLGLDRNSFETCLRSDRHAELVTASRVLGDQLGVNSTPTVLINGKRVGDPFDWEAYPPLLQAGPADTAALETAPSAQ